VTVGDRRYILCRNQQEAERDAAARQAILANLERQLASGDKALVGNTGFRRFLKTEGDSHFAIDPAKAEQDARFDGVFVLRTNTDLDPLAAMLRYKHLWTIEATFRTAKHLLATRPIFHRVDETIRGHVFCSFAATRGPRDPGTTNDSSSVSSPRRRRCPAAHRPAPRRRLIPTPGCSATPPPRR
jgi:transposase